MPHRARPFHTGKLGSLVLPFILLSGVLVVGQESLGSNFEISLHTINLYDTT